MNSLCCNASTKVLSTRTKDNVVTRTRQCSKCLDRFKSEEHFTTPITIKGGGLSGLPLAKQVDSMYRNGAKVSDISRLTTLLPSQIYYIMNKLRNGGYGRTDKRIKRKE